MCFFRQGRKDARTQGRSDVNLEIKDELNLMNQTDFVTGVYEIAWQSNPDLNSGSTFQEILEELKKMKDKSMRWDILVSSFKGEVERPTLRDTQAARQGQL